MVSVSFIYRYNIMKVRALSIGGEKLETNRVREYREKAGLTQVELARRARIASPNLSSIERGRLLPWSKVKRALAKALKCTEAELFPVERQQDGE